MDLSQIKKGLFSVKPTAEKKDEVITTPKPAYSG